MSTSRTALTAHLLINAEALDTQGWSREQLLSEAREHLSRLGIRKCTIELKANEWLSS